jgi:hypothetical protein
VLGLAPFSFTNSFVVKEMSTAWVLYTIVLFVVVLASSILEMVQRLQHIDMLRTAILSEFIFMFFGTLQAVASILISVIITGEKSRKVVCKVVKIDKGLFLILLQLTGRRLFSLWHKRLQCIHM